MEGQKYWGLFKPYAKAALKLQRAAFGSEVVEMNQMVRTTLDLEQYQCRRCGRLFYINGLDRSSLGLDFGCPYGCDDNGKHIRDIGTEVKHVKQRDD